MAITFEVRIRFLVEEPGKADLLRCALSNIGVPMDQSIEKLERGTTVVSFYENSRRRANAFSARIRSLKLKGVRVSIARLQDRDWTTRWKKYFKPFNISRDIRVVPLWMKNAKIPAGSTAVYLDTTFAFGSGLHATTRMMARFMYMKEKHCGSFLDIGTGSGILALIARAYGTRDVFAIDMDPVSIKTAENNCLHNRCNFEYLKAVKFESFRSRKQFDFVAANLLTEDLLRLQTKLIEKVSPGGYLAVSGIFYKNYAYFRKHFAGGAFVCAAAAREKDWCAVLFKKKRPRKALYA
ncbi:MAG: 50S ribosomal protein L11 methyltransferase [Candidatus Omnitrophota bacterium]